MKCANTAALNNFLASFHRATSMLLFAGCLRRARYPSLKNFISRFLET